jgi:hypothetical protein
MQALMIQRVMKPLYFSFLPLATGDVVHSVYCFSDLSNRLSGNFQAK